MEGKSKKIQKMFRTLDDRTKDNDNKTKKLRKVEDVE